jgi:hypothetical protein
VLSASLSLFITLCCVFFVPFNIAQGTLTTLQPFKSCVFVLAVLLYRWTTALKPRKALTVIPGDTTHFGGQWF